MSESRSFTTVCPKCGASIRSVGYPFIIRGRDIAVDTALKDGRLFELTCPSCGYFDLATYRCTYFDPASHTLIVFDRLSPEDEVKSYADAQKDAFTIGSRVPSMRWVTHADILAEKARILDFGLDDRAVEIAKLKTQEWMTGLDELHSYAQLIFGETTDQGDLVFEVYGLLDEDNRTVIYYRSDYDLIVAELNDAGAGDDFIVDRAWAERFMKRRMLECAEGIG